MEKANAREQSVEQAKIDTNYMSRALELALKGAGSVNPNPMVGAVIVRDGNIIAEGYHKKYGELHAEREALKDCAKKGFSAKGATMYVTLEPCCHYGKTPPCTEAIIEAGIARVVVGVLDSNSKMNGKGIEILSKAGIDVTIGVLASECIEVNRVFFHYIKNKTPFVVLKYAMTLDGKIATVRGESKWISCEASRKKVHQDRGFYSAIMVGIGTVLADNPLLTARNDTNNTKNPLRIICDTQLRTPLDSQIVQTAKEVRTIIATCKNDLLAHKHFQQKGCEILCCVQKDNHIDLSDLMQKLGALGIDSILLEGGSMLNFSALQSGIVQRVQTYIAPKIFGGKSAKTPIGGEGVLGVREAFKLKTLKTEYIDSDILIESEVYTCSPE